MNSLIERAQSCLLGHALDSLVEFQTPEQIQRVYPDGVRELFDAGV